MGLVEVFSTNSITYRGELGKFWMLGTAFAIQSIALKIWSAFDCNIDDIDMSYRQHHHGIFIYPEAEDFFMQNTVNWKRDGF